MKGITWRFNPLSAPHFGGSWERLVKSCKKAMFFVMRYQIMSDDVLHTVLCTVEQILNNRPLTANSNDPSDLEALTPNHFLLGRPSHSIPFYAQSDVKSLNFKKAFRTSELLTNAIWVRWMKEYLPQLTARSKWLKDTEQPRKGDLVWVTDSLTKKGKYPLAKILELHLGDDGVCRSATVKTQKGTFLRPLVKLIPLNIETFSIQNENGAGDVGAESDSI